MLLRNFADAEGFLWYFDKSRPFFKPVKRHIRSIFYRDDYYSISTKGGAVDLSVETRLSKLEHAASVIIEKICMSARAGQLPNLTPFEKMTWDRFVFSQWKRTPDSVSGKFHLDEVRQWVVDAIAEAEIFSRKVSLDERNKMLSDENIESIWNDTRSRNVLETSGNVEGILNGMGICVAHITNPQKSFLVGSKPVVKLTGASTRLGDPDVELWLPIAHDVAVSPMPRQGEALNNAMTPFQIRGLNEAISKESQQIASRSSELLTSILH
jgi:hypothetical protein